LVGDLLDISFKANRRNLRLLHRHLSERGVVDGKRAQAPTPAPSEST